MTAQSTAVQTTEQCALVGFIFTAALLVSGSSLEGSLNVVGWLAACRRLFVTSVRESCPLRSGKTGPFYRLIVSMKILNWFLRSPPNPESSWLRPGLKIWSSGRSAISPVEWKLPVFGYHRTANNRLDVGWMAGWLAGGCLFVGRVWIYGAENWFSNAIVGKVRLFGFPHEDAASGLELCFVCELFCGCVEIITLMCIRGLGNKIYQRKWLDCSFVRCYSTYQYQLTTIRSRNRFLFVEYINNWIRADIFILEIIKLYITGVFENSISNCFHGFFKGFLPVFLKNSFYNFFRYSLHGFSQNAFIFP